MCMRSTDGTTSIDSLLDASDFDVVVASGGDGTVTSVAAWHANTGVPLLPYPAGTANLLSLNLAQPNEPRVGRSSLGIAETQRLRCRRESFEPKAKSTAS